MVRKLPKPIRMKIKTGDTVYVLSGKDKGRRGRVIRVMPRENRIIVDGINLVTKHQKPRTATGKGSRIQKPAPIFASKVMLVCPHCDQPTRVRRVRSESNRLVRVCKRCGEMIDTTQ
ncbi:50S ribosomal protein L24 [bacterium HR15]|uniref:50S ribosomal protein L24 n=1 Tax=uncultured prokaryote TaxID=198431 RepID=H5SJZ2_9ZZZZ|nr:50S ribosomal protein L24 [uncultured prokaryote]GBC93316.1 50S ribosomal protein L24 [bacterium HR15]